jgi:ketosteroid isomerase-like protein
MSSKQPIGPSKAIRRLVACVGLAACAAPSEQGFDLVHREAIVDSVQAFYSEMQAAINGNRWGELADFYADDDRLLILEDGEVAYRSRDEIRTAMNAMVGSFDSAELSVSDRVIEPLGPGLAASTFSYTQTFSSSEGESLSFSGVLIQTLIHTPDGWKILLAHTSTRRDREWGAGR